jgi:hypothetical protein
VTSVKGRARKASLLLHASVSRLDVMRAVPASVFTLFVVDIVDVVLQRDAEGKGSEWQESKLERESSQ